MFSNQDLAAAQGEKKDAGRSKFVKELLDFTGGHLAMIVMFKVAVNTALIATIRKVELGAERNPEFECLGAHLLHQRGHGFTWPSNFGSASGSRETNKMPSPANYSTNPPSSAKALPTSPSNC